MLRSTSVLALGALLWLNAAGLQAQGEAVRITVPRANVRAAASTSSPVLTQVTSGTVLPLKVVEGSWFLVEVATGGLRVEGWVSSTVATRVSAVERATASAANGLAATAAPVSLRGVSVAIQSETEASPLTPEAAAIRVIDADANSLRGLLRVFPADDAPLKATGGEPATFVWTLPGRSSDRVIGDRRPALLVSYAGIDGLPHTDVVPAVVRLATTLSGIRLVASVRAPVNQTARTETDWNLHNSLREDVVRTTVERFEPGTVRLRPSSNLDVGEYAVVLRLRRNVAGAAALSTQGDGGVLSTVWAFSIR